MMVARSGSKSMRIGRPTTSGVEGEKSTISVRTAVDLKRQLDEAAKWSGRSLSQEAESRLEQSFRDDHWAHLFSDVFYGRELATLLEIIGRAMRDAGAHAVNQTVAPGDPWPNWIDSP